jgi:hypothetical protein
LFIRAVFFECLPRGSQGVPEHAAVPGQRRDLGPSHESDRPVDFSISQPGTRTVEGGLDERHCGRALYFDVTVAP